MFPDLNFVDYVMLLFGLLLCFKRVAEMERYYHLRVIIFTSIFGAMVVFLLLAFGAMLEDHFRYDYIINDVIKALTTSPSHHRATFIDDENEVQWAEISTLIDFGSRRTTR
jgi:hypothetical protein